MEIYNYLLDHSLTTEYELRKRDCHEDINHGKTVKYADLCSDINPSILDHQKRVSMNDNKILEKITILEDHPIIRQYKKINSKEFYLNSSELWDEVMHLLEENYEQKKIHRIRGCWYNLITEISYYLPIIREEIHKQAIIIPKQIEKKKKKEQFLFKFMGQKFDTRLIYHRQNDNFKVYGELKMADELFLLNNISLQGKLKVSGFGKNLIINTLNNGNMVNTKSKKWSSDDFYIRHVEYDLGKNYLISHFSIMGKQHQSKLFPNYDEKKIHHIRHNEHIKFVDEITPIYVKSFQLMIRRDKSKIWTNLGSFPGNSNRLVEVVHSLSSDIYGRYIRIIPLAFQGEPSFQFAVYTPKVNVVTANNLPSKNITNETNENSFLTKCIEYKLSIPSITTKFISCRNKPRYAKFFKQNPLRHANRQCLKETCKKEMKQYDETIL